MNENPTPQPPTMTTTPPATVPPPATTVPPAVIVERKSAGLAGFLSMFPGLGHLYLGLYQRAFAFAGAFVFLIAITSHGRRGEFFGPLIFFVWVFAIIDAVRQAKAINRGQVAEAGFAPAVQLKRSPGTAGLTWGVILVGLGALWLLHRYDLLDRFLDAIPDWGAPGIFILLGVILIVTHVQKRRREHESGIGMPPSSR